MGKIRKEYKEDRMESYGYTSQTSESSRTSGSSESSSSDSESSSSTDRKRKHTRKKSKYKKEKKRRSDSEGEPEYMEREKKKRRKHTKYKDVDETSEEEEEEEEEYIRVEERKHRSRKHKHHHRKHKHKHRRHRHHRSEEEYQERRRGASVERGESKREREDWEERQYDKVEKDRRVDKELDKKNRKEEKRHKERGDSRQVKSKWDDDEDVQYNNKRIKPDPDADDTRNHPKVKQEGDRSKKRKEREEATENGRANWGTLENASQNVKDEDEPDKEEAHKPNMGLSGKLTEDTNTFNGVIIKYSQPPEARKPKRRWRWYIFKGEEDLPFLPLHRQSAYLIGRDRKVADIPTDHPSCSKQHAVLQYRLVTYEREDGTKGRTVKPYILDLESANGTYVNNRRVEARRFVELIEKDVVKFGYSSREYILLHEGSKGDDADAPDMGVDMSPVSLLRN